MFALHFLVLVDGEVVTLFANLLHGDKEGLLLAGALGLALKVVETGNEVGDVVLAYLVALLVEGVAVGLHVVEPDVVGASGIGLGEDEDGGAYARVGQEHARGHRDDGLQAVVVYEFLADGLVSGAIAKEHAVGHDAGTTATSLQHAHEEGQEEEFRLLGLGDGKQGLAHRLVV